MHALVPHTKVMGLGRWLCELDMESHGRSRIQKAHLDMVKLHMSLALLLLPLGEDPFLINNYDTVGNKYAL